MKFKTFRNFILIPGIVLVFVLVILGIRGIFRVLTKPAASARNQLAASTSPSSPASNSSAPPANPGESSQSATTAQTELRREDRLIINFLNTHQAATEGKLKDIFPGEKFKVNLYRDGDSSSWTRLKIDLNRNNKDDEKWTLNNGLPSKRSVSSRDDEQYDQKYAWAGDHWILQSGG